MATTLANDIFKFNFAKENVLISMSISLNFVPEDQIDNKKTLIQGMAWHQIGNKPLPEPMMAQLNDTYMCHAASMS